MNLKNAIIIGGSGELGLAISKFLLLNNYKIIITFKNKNKKKKIEREISNFKKSYYLKNCDLESEKSIKKTIFFANKHLGDIDLVINAAGVFYYDIINKLNYSKILSTFKINALSTIVINKEIKKNKKNKNFTKIISIGSSSSLAGYKDTVTYCGSKHALSGIVRSLNKTIYKNKIINYCINTGSLKNKMGRKVKNQNFEKFIDQKEIIKSIKFLIDINPPAIPEDIFIRRFI